MRERKSDLLTDVIDKCLIMTVPRSIKRQWAVLGGMMAMGVPYENICFIAGEDALDYGNDMAQVADAAADEGYSFLRQFAVGAESYYVRQSAGNVALFWNWVRTLEWIASSGETCLLIWDDRVLSTPYEVVCKVVAQLRARHVPFGIFQMRLQGDWSHMNIAGRMDFAEADDVEQERRFFTRSVPFVDDYDMYLEHGLLGFDETMVLSPMGAQWLCNRMLYMEDRSEELKNHKFRDIFDEVLVPENAELRMRSRLNNDNWLFFDNLDTAPESMGIYHPRRIGYEFVRDWMQLGTNVHWRTEYVPEGQEQTRINFLDM